jgi:hypothetical protein
MGGICSTNGENRNAYRLLEGKPVGTGFYSASNINEYQKENSLA